jgi:hypothetical protein
MTEVTCVLDAKAGLGECPVWSAEEQALYWVDTVAPGLHRLDPATGTTRSWPMPKPIGSFALRENGGAVVALTDGFYAFDLVAGWLRFVAGPPSVPGTRFNDGNASPDGRFFACRMDVELLSRPLGALYRLDPDSSMHQVADGLLVSNGLGWSPDGKTMFHSDSKAKTIWAYDYREGEVSGRRVVVERVRRGEERVSHVQGWFFIHRLENVGATGLRRSWTDNLLWHHTTHLVDLGLWLIPGDDMTTTDARIRSVYSGYPPIEPRTGIPMELVLVIETLDDQTIVTTGSYDAREYINDTRAVTDRDSYRLDERRSTLYTGDGDHPIATEQENAELIASDFIAGVAEHREAAVPGWSVLPAMRVPHRVQGAWDVQNGKQIIPSRPVV